MLSALGGCVGGVTLGGVGLEGAPSGVLVVSH